MDLTDLANKELSYTDVFKYFVNLSEKRAPAS